MSKRSPGRNAWLSDYQDALVQAAGIAYILGLTDHAKTLHELSCQAMGIDTAANQRQKDIDTEVKTLYHKGNQAENTPRKQEGKTMRKLKVYLKTPYAFAVEVDGKEVYSTGKARDIASYCKRHFGVDIPTETRNYPTGTKTHFDGLTKNGFEFDIE